MNDVLLQKRPSDVGCRVSLEIAVRDVLHVYVFVGVVLQTTEETRRRHRSDRARSEGGYVN